MMTKAIIKIAIRQVIDASSTGDFERKVFHDSYCEFLLQAQSYNQDNRFQTFREILDNNPKANSLHYKVGFAIGLFVKELNGAMPGVHDTLGNSLAFAGHRFEIISSNVTQKAAHRVALIYESAPLILLHVAGEYLLLTKENFTGQPLATFVVKLREDLSVTEYQEINDDEGSIKFGERASA